MSSSEEAIAIKHLLTRNVEEVIDRAHLERRLASGEKLRVKLGIDPTSPDLHLGHAVVLRKLKEFQDLGHQIVLIIGDFTGRIGDPSGRDKARPSLDEREIKENMEKYLGQVKKIIDVKKAEVVYNSQWLKKLDGAKLLELLGLLSVQQIIERSDFRARLEAHESIRMHELIYPVLQAYDSAQVRADVEIGGNDQTFNLLAGRTLMERLGMKPQDVLTASLLEGVDGKRKMSKSLGNYIGLTEEPGDMFGKIMSVPDKLVHKYFMLCTELDEKEIQSLEKTLKPRDLKARLGFEIVKLYHGEAAARGARENFEKVFSKKEAPEDLLALKAGPGITALLLVSKVIKSRSEARRLIQQGGFDIDGTQIKDPNKPLEFHGGEVVRIGKKKFFRISV